MANRAPILTDRRGNLAISAALVAPMIIGALALGVDYGSLTLQQRELQQAADLAAISAASELSAPEEALARHFIANGIDIPVLKGGQMLTSSGEIPLDAGALPDGLAFAQVGRYSADPSQPARNRFTPGVTRPDAVKVELRRKANLYFAEAITQPPVLSATAVAAAHKVAAFTIGSRLASLDGGIINALLGGLLGTSVSLDVMDYRALVDARVDAIEVIDALALSLDLKTGTYQDVLDAEIGMGRLLQAIGSSKGLSSRVNTALARLAQAANRTDVTVDLGKIIALGPIAAQPIGSAVQTTLALHVFDLISAAATAANGGSQIALDLGGGVPGLAAARLTLAIGEPPVGTPVSAVGEPGTIIRTAQTRLALELTTAGALQLAGMKLRVPVYLEVAHAEARLAGIECRTGGQADVRIEAVPGLVELGIGDVDPKAFANFGDKPRITRANILDAPLLKIKARSSVNVTNMEKKSITFSRQDISAGKLKSLSTADTLTSLQTSLLKTLDLDIDVLALSVASPKLLQGAVAETLSQLTVPLDLILYNTLLTLGLRVGEVDIAVTDASCKRPVLVQ